MSALYQMDAEEKHRHKTAFSSMFGKYEFNRIPFGLKGSPILFQKAISTILRKYLGVCLLCYCDDLIIYSSTFSDHLKHIDQILKTIRDNNLTAKLNKCMFASSKIQFLGHVFSQEGIYPGEEKTKLVKNALVPTNVKKLQRFLGLSNYFRRFIKSYAQIAKPLYNLLNRAPSLNGTKIVKKHLIR